VFDLTLFDRLFVTAQANAQRRARILTGEYHIALRIHLMTGHAVRDIVRLATEIKAVLVVIGATSHSQFYERMLGSRADRLVHLAPRPVLVVREIGPKRERNCPLCLIA
jgi:nucleotide-binding universal stress UspA family protein